VTTWRALRAEIEAQLGSEHEARFLIEEASGYSVNEWLDIADSEPSRKAEAHARDMCARRLAGEPLQYVLGNWSFCGHDLMVDSRVLIPRPETELVVEVALESARGTVTKGTAIADLGTGSGAIAIALAASFPTAEVWATDVSDDALDVARANVAGNALANVQFGTGSWFDALPEARRGQFSLIVSNPPYIAESEVGDLPRVVVEYEPRGALISGSTGFEALHEIIDGATEWLTDTGVLICEIAPHQDTVVAERATERGFTTVAVRKDLTARSRVLVARRG
jgi:release factor glutamine methyltransferase